MTPTTPQPGAVPTCHASDCAVHNEPAYPNGPCDCGFLPQPGAVLSVDDVKLLRAGDWLRHPQCGAVQFDRFDDSERRAFMTGADGQVGLLVPAGKMTFLGRPDAEGWIDFTGGPMPCAPDLLVDVRWGGSDRDRVDAGLAASLWGWIGQDNWDPKDANDIIAWRPHVLHTEAPPTRSAEAVEGDTPSAIAADVRKLCQGHPHAKIAWPHRDLHAIADRIEALSSPTPDAGAGEPVAWWCEKPDGTGFAVNADPGDWPNMTVYRLAKQPPAPTPGLEEKLRAALEIERALRKLSRAIGAMDPEIVSGEVFDAVIDAEHALDLSEQAK